jgi:uncharacterized damage-inducible protein DinB
MTTNAERVSPPAVADEPTMLTSWLDFERATLLRKCAGLAPDQLRERSAPPSTLSLLGLVRHMAEVERMWFRHGVAGEELQHRWVTDEREDADFDDAGSADIDEAFGAFEEEVARSRAIVGEASSLDQTFENKRGKQISLRWVLVHMIEEYARHNGHADLLRQRIDSETGY